MAGAHHLVVCKASFHYETRTFSYSLGKRLGTFQFLMSFFIVDIYVS
jgi:hypothetical protein